MVVKKLLRGMSVVARWGMMKARERMRKLRCSTMMLKKAMGISTPLGRLEEDVWDEGGSAVSLL